MLALSCVDMRCHALSGALILTPCPYDPITTLPGALILTPCPYDPINALSGAWRVCEQRYAPFNAHYCGLLAQFFSRFFYNEKKKKGFFFVPFRMGNLHFSGVFFQYKCRTRSRLLRLRMNLCAPMGRRHRRREDTTALSCLKGSHRRCRCLAGCPWH